MYRSYILTLERQLHFAQRASKILKRLNILQTKSVHVKAVMNRHQQNELLDRLFSVAANGQTEQLEPLLKLSEIDINAKNSKGWNALMLAGRNGQLEVVKKLISEGADISQTNNIGQTINDIAAFWNHQHIVDYLNMKDSDYNPLEQVHFFSVCHLDRAGDKRKDETWLTEVLKQEGRAQIHVFIKTFPVLVKGKKSSKLCGFSYEDVNEFLTGDKKPDLLFLGIDEKTQQAIFALNLNKAVGQEFLHKFTEKQLQVLERIRDAFFLQKEDASVAGLAHSIFDWHRKSKFCECCGSKTRLAEAGYKRVCSNTSCVTVKEVKNSSYPRVDPSIIAAVVSPDKQHLLLARGRKFLPNMWSCVAGFVEPGESIENATRREIYEETGIKIGKVIYHSTQPWPFPTQLMFGMIAYASNDVINIDPNELADARWFTKPEVISMLTGKHPGGLFVPPHQAIAHHLIKQFIHLQSRM